MKGYNIAKAPLYYVRSGDIYLVTGLLGGPGIGGYGWSARTYPDATSAYNLLFVSTTVGAARSYGRWYGFPLRCGWKQV